MQYLQQMQKEYGDVLDEVYKHFSEEVARDESEEEIKVALIRKTKCTENLHL